MFEKEYPQASLLKSELLLTNFEIRLVFTRLRYPSIADPVRRIDGTRIDLATLVDVLSRTFNVRINNPEQCHHTLINRKLRNAFS